MAGIYKLTQTELRFLLMFAEKRGMYGFEEMPLIEEKAEAGECVRSLCGKGILKADEEQKYEMDKTLELLLSIAEQPYGCFFMEDLRNEDTVRKTVVYFRDDVIGAVEQTGEMWEFLWIPYLTLAIGETANLHEPFLNAVTERPVVETDGDRWIDERTRDGFAWQWEMWGEQLEDEKKQCSMSVLSDGKIQFVVKETDGDRRIFCPDKADYINEITREMAYIHGKSISKMLQREG